MEKKIKEYDYNYKLKFEGEYINDKKMAFVKSMTEEY